MSSMYDKILRVITVPPEERSIQIIEPLLPWFRKKSDVFGSLKSDVVIDILRNCSFITRPRDYVIIKQGDTGDCFYIILRGTVSIFINNTISDEEDESKIAEHSRDAKVTFTERGELDRSKYGNFIVQFAAGKSFGELALINKNCIRNASIIVDEDTDLLVVNRELYNRSLKAAQTAEFEMRKKFVKEHAGFQYWAPKHKKQLAMSLEKVKIPFEGCVCRQGDPANRIYFLLRGQAKILIDGAQHQIQYPQYYPLQDPDEIIAREELEMDSVQHLPKKKEVQTNIYEKPHGVAPSAQRRKERAKKLTELSIVGETEIIGDTEFVIELKTYLQTVECTEECLVYALDMKNYERLVTKRNPKTIDFLRQNSEIKLQGRISRLMDDQAPLLKTLLFQMEKVDRTQTNQLRKREEHHVGSFTSNPYDPVPHRGPLIDMYGPGSVYYRSRMREQAKQKQKSKSNFRGARTGFALPMTQLQPPLDLSSHMDRSTHMMPNGAYDRDSEEDYDYEREGTTFVTDKDIQPYGSPFLDYKSSDKALTVLEDRIKQWYATISVNKPRRAAAPKSAVKLERVRIAKGKELVPGRQVILRKRQPHVFHGVSSLSSNETSVLSVSPGRSSGVDSGRVSPKAQLHSRRLQETEERIIQARENDDLSGPLLTPSTFLRLYLKRPSPTESDCDYNRPPPLESKGTILDVIKNQEVIEGKIVSGIHTHGHMIRFNNIRPVCLVQQDSTRNISQTLPAIVEPGVDQHSEKTGSKDDVTLPQIPLSMIGSQRGFMGNSDVTQAMALTAGGDSSSDIIRSN